MGTPMHEQILDDEGARARRTLRGRMTLLAILAFLILLLAVISLFFINVLDVTSGVSDESLPPQLSWVRSIYGWGPSAGDQLLGPTSVAFSPSGSVYITDPQRGQVLEFGLDGSLESVIIGGHGGSTPEQLVRPESLAVDDDGNLYIADSFGLAVSVFDADGTFVRRWETGRATGIDVVEDEVLLFRKGEIRVYSLDGEHLYSIGSFGFGAGEVLNVTSYGVTTDGDRIFVADTHNRAIKAFSRDGDLIWSQPNLEPGAQALSPSETDDYSSQPADTETFQVPQDLVMDAADRLVAIDAFAFKIVVLDPETGQVIDSFGEFGQADGDFLYPTGIDYDARLDVFAVADTANDRVQILRISGSGGGAVEAVRRALVSPYRVFFLPLLLLLLAVTVMAVTQRRRRALAESLEDVWMPEDDT